MLPDLPNHLNQSQEAHSATQNVLSPPETASPTVRESRFFAIRTKITFGYTVAVAVPVIGALVGLMVGNHYQKDAAQRLTNAYQEQKLLNNLQVTILQNRPAKELTPFVEDATAFRQAADKIRTRIIDLEQLVAQLERAKSHAMMNFSPQLQTYQKTLATFSQELKTLVQESQNLRESQTSKLIKQRILELVNGSSFSQLIQFADQINAVTIEVNEDVLVAQDQMQRAEVLRMQIILGSLVASIIAAILLTIYTSQAIARPLESLTNVAQQVTRDTNTSLRFTNITKDEVGTLATALNQLLDWVNTYTRELKNAQLHLVQVEKMSSLGQLVAGVAHEINNPVNFIHGNIGHIDTYTQDMLKVIQAYQLHYPNPPPTLQETLDEVELDFLNEDLIKLLQSMRVGTDRIRQIVLSLRSFSRLDEAEFKAVDLHEGIDNTLLILQHRLKERPESAAIEVVKNYGQLPLVECYPGQLNQVFMNLLANAIDALQDSLQQPAKDKRLLESSTIWISTQEMTDKQVRIVIADNGVGFPETVRSRLFDPFFTTKSVGKGTGLGLSISYQIVTERHRGKIWCDSTPGEGSKFVVEIPIGQSAPRSA